MRIQLSTYILRTWEVPRSKAWSLVAPAPQAKTDADNAPFPFAYSSKYKHLLNIRSISEEDEEDMQKYSSMVEKEWKSFMQSGFAPPDNAKLRFDLTGKRTSTSVSSFSGNGHV